MLPLLLFHLLSFSSRRRLQLGLQKQCFTSHSSSRASIFLLNDHVKSVKSKMVKTCVETAHNGEKIHWWFLALVCLGPRSDWSTRAPVLWGRESTDKMRDCQDAFASPLSNQNRDVVYSNFSKAMLPRY